MPRAVSTGPTRPTNRWLGRIRVNPGRCAETYCGERWDTVWTGTRKRVSWIVFVCAGVTQYRVCIVPSCPN